MKSHRYNENDEARFLELINEYNTVHREESKRAQERNWGSPSEPQRIGFQPNPE